MPALKLVPFTKTTKAVHTKLNCKTKKEVERLAKYHETDQNHIINSLVEMGLKSIKGTKELAKK